MDNDLKILIIFCLIIIILFVILPLSISVIVDYNELQTFNKLRGTSYTYGQWFSSEEVIEEYEGNYLNIKLNELKYKGTK